MDDSVALLYAPKMLTFSSQVEEFDDEYIRKLEKFVSFTSCVYLYINYWICGSIGRDAPVLDLALGGKSAGIPTR